MYFFQDPVVEIKKMMVNNHPLLNFSWRPSDSACEGRFVLATYQYVAGITCDVTTQARAASQKLYKHFHCASARVAG